MIQAENNDSLGMDARTSAIKLTMAGYLRALTPISTIVGFLILYSKKVLAIGTSYSFYGGLAKVPECYATCI